MASVIKKLLQKDAEKRPDIARIMTYRQTLEAVKSFLHDIGNPEIYWNLRRPIIRDFSREYCAYV